MRKQRLRRVKVCYFLPCSISVLPIVVQHPIAQSCHPEAPSTSWLICLSIWVPASVLCSCALCWSSNIISIRSPPPEVGDLFFQFNNYSNHFSGNSLGSGFKVHLQVKELGKKWVEKSKLTTREFRVRTEKLPLFFPSLRGWAARAALTELRNVKGGHRGAPPDKPFSIN